MKRKTYLLDTLKENEVISTIVLKNKRAWRLDIEKKYDEIIEAFRNREICEFNVINYNPFYKLTFRKWNENLHKYIEIAYLYRFEEN